MRHGQSKANVAGVIVSRIENDHRGDYGLSELGRQQVLAAALAVVLWPFIVVFGLHFHVT